MKGFHTKTCTNTYTKRRPSHHMEKYTRNRSSRTQAHQDTRCDLINLHGISFYWLVCNVHYIYFRVEGCNQWEEAQVKVCWLICNVLYIYFRVEGCDQWEEDQIKGGESMDSQQGRRPSPRSYMYCLARRRAETRHRKNVSRATTASQSVDIEKQY